MPNPADLNGLTFRQIIEGGRKLIAFSERNTFTCTVYDGAFNRSVRMSGNQLPVVVDVHATGTVRVECVDETAGQNFTFFIPAAEYLVPLKR